MTETQRESTWYGTGETQDERQGLVLLPENVPPLGEVVARARATGLRRIQLLAWRDLEDPEAGGSERHAHHIATLWANAGLDVTLRTSSISGLPARAQRDGYQVLRNGKRYSVFPRSALSGFAERRRGPDGLVEIWNGMPFFSPLWAQCPRIVFLHHVHAEMWRMVLRPGRARAGELLERRIAPLFYRRSRVVTLSESSRREIVSILGLRHDRVSVVAPGIDPLFSPGGARAAAPLVAAVGRLVPVKRFDLLIEALVEARSKIPSLHAVIVGEGYERPQLEHLRQRLGAEDWLDLPGFMDDVGLRDVYRRAWVVASTSQREGWGMTISEAGACGTPAVASRIAGHLDAVEQGSSGFLVDIPVGTGVDRAESVIAFARSLQLLIDDAPLRARLGRAAQARFRGYSWEATAAGALAALVDETESARKAPV